MSGRKLILERKEDRKNDRTFSAMIVDFVMTATRRKLSKLYHLKKIGYFLKKLY